MDNYINRVECKGGWGMPQISAHDLNHVNMPDGNMVEMYMLEGSNTNTIADNNVSTATEEQKSFN